MSIDSIDVADTKAVRCALLGLLGVVITGITFSGTINHLVEQWAAKEEYSHGFLIPVVALSLIWMRRDFVRASIGNPSWWGCGVLLFALGLHLLGKASAIPIFSQIGLVLTIVGLVLGIGGYSLLRATIFPILFLFFAIPMPSFIESNLSLKLQLLSSQLGASFIKLLGIPVYLDGNIIDLGYYKIQVVDACSGLRYIYPLLGLSFLAAYLFRAPIWQRGLIFISAVPITILMNSIRIGIIGVAVYYGGNKQAEGILHLFEGWVIFLVCAGVLTLEIYVFARLSGRTFTDVFSLPQLKFDNVPRPKPEWGGTSPILVSLLFLSTGCIASIYLSNRTELIPDRPRFVAFPERISGWQGRTFLLDSETEQLLKLDDYILSDYTGADGKAVNLYVAYYASQRKGNAPHSPNDCMPGSGWKITKLEQVVYRDETTSWPVNRAVIEKNSVKQVVYYWFNEQGRDVANEYLAKWYLHLGALLKNRTDGALVRLIAEIRRGETEADAERRLRTFISDASPILSQYIPSDFPLGGQVRVGSAGKVSR